MAAGIADGLQHFHEFFKGQVLMTIGVETGCSGLLEDVSKRGLSDELGSEDQGIDKKSNQAFQVFLGPPGNGRANENIALPAVAGQKN